MRPRKFMTPAMSSPAPDWFERHAEQQTQLQQVLALIAERIVAQTEAMKAAPAASAPRRRRAPGEDVLVPPGEREVQLQKALEEFSDRLLGRTPR